jgi:predicted ATPase
LDDLVGTAMGLVAPGSRRQTIVEAIGSRRVLVILDNAEHLLDAVRDLTTVLLQRCGGLRVIVTSREPLGVLGEHVWPVRSLAAAHAATLFHDRARAVRPDVVANEVMVERICTRLDGIPMAIELAAARTRSLPVTEISDRLAHTFEVLTLGRRGALERHQTMRATIDWSYQLLHDDERTLFNRLAVFAGGFDASAVEAIAGYPPLENDQIRDLLDQLSAKSMIVADIYETTTRYRMLESLRQFAAERLSSEAMDVAARHAAYYTALAQERGGWAMGNEVNAECLVTEFDNLRAAFTHARATGDVDTALRLTTPLHALWTLYDFAEAGVWVGAAADLDGAERHPLSSTAHGQAAYAASFRVDAAARDHHLECGGESRWKALAQAFYGTHNKERLAEARRGLELALAEHSPYTADLDLVILVVSVSLGAPDEDALDRIRRYADRGSDVGLLVLRVAEAAIAINLGTEDDALAAYDALLAQCERFKRRTGARYYAPVPRFLLLFRRDRLAALRDARSYLIEARKIGTRTWLQCALARIAVMLAAVGREQPAAVLQAFTQEPAGGTVMADGDPGANITYTALTEAQLASARRAGQMLDFDGAIQLALDELDASLLTTTV